MKINGGGRCHQQEETPAANRCPFFCHGAFPDERYWNQPYGTAGRNVKTSVWFPWHGTRVKILFSTSSKMVP